VQDVPHSTTRRFREIRGPRDYVSPVLVRCLPLSRRSREAFVLSTGAYLSRRTTSPPYCGSVRTRMPDGFSSIPLIWRYANQFISGTIRQMASRADCIAGATASVEHAWPTDLFFSANSSPSAAWHEHDLNDLHAKRRSWSSTHEWNGEQVSRLYLELLGFHESR